MRYLVSLLCGICLLAAAVPAQARRGKKARTLSPVTDASFAEIVKKNGGEGLELYASKVGRFIYSRGPGGGGYWFLTGDHCSPEGYQGPTSVAVEISADGGEIKKCVLVQSRETLSYVRKYFMSGKKKGGNPFFAQFTGMPLSGGAKGPELEVDAVSGATMTSRAIKEAVEATCAEVLPMIRSTSLGSGAPVNDAYAVEKVKIPAAEGGD